MNDLISPGIKSIGKIYNFVNFDLWKLREKETDMISKEPSYPGTCECNYQYFAKKKITKTILGSLTNCHLTSTKFNFALG